MTDTAELEKLFPHRERVKKPQTNADKIREMSDEELAKLIGSMIDHEYCDYKGCIVKQSGLCGFPDIGCDEAALKWLKQEAKDEQS